MAEGPAGQLPGTEPRACPPSYPRSPPPLLPLPCRPGGPNYAAGLDAMRAVGAELGLQVDVFGPEASMTGICQVGAACLPACLAALTRRSCCKQCRARCRLLPVRGATAADERCLRRAARHAPRNPPTHVMCSWRLTTSRPPPPPTAPAHRRRETTAAAPAACYTAPAHDARPDSCPLYHRSPVLPQTKLLSSLLECTILALRMSPTHNPSLLLKSNSRCVPEFYSIPEPTQVVHAGAVQVPCCSSSEREDDKGRQGGGQRDSVGGAQRKGSGATEGERGRRVRVGRGSAEALGNRGLVRGLVSTGAVVRRSDNEMHAGGWGQKRMQEADAGVGC